MLDPIFKEQENLRYIHNIFSIGTHTWLITAILMWLQYIGLYHSKKRNEKKSVQSFGTFLE